MARPLTNTEPNGELYQRPASVEAQIDEVVLLSRSDLRDRLMVTDRKDPRYLRSECLVHLMRKGRRSDDQQLMGAVLPVLLNRCEAILHRKVPDGGVPDAGTIRQKILEDLTDLFVIDGSGDFPNELDFYECRFNRAFMTLRVDGFRSEMRRRQRTITTVEIPPLEVKSMPSAKEDAFARISEAFRAPPTQQWEAFRKTLAQAIGELPPEERDAVILVHGLGYKVESEDPREETAATRCGCSGRTIRYRLSRAAAKLAHLKEEL